MILKGVRRRVVNVSSDWAIETFRHFAVDCRHDGWKSINLLFAHLTSLICRIRYKLVRPSLLDEGSKLVESAHILFKGVL